MKGRAIGAMVIGDARFVVSVAVTFGMLLSGVFVQTAHAEKYSIQDIAAVGLGATVEGVNERGDLWERSGVPKAAQPASTSRVRS